VDGDAAADQAAHLIALPKDVEREGEHGLDLGGVGLQVQLSRMRDAADEGVDAVAGDESAGGGELLAELDRRGLEADLLMGLAQRGGCEVGVGVVLASAGKRDLAGVPSQVRPPLGEDQAGIIRPAIERQQDRRVSSAVDL
jgi:hypothetical protein